MIFSFLSSLKSRKLTFEGSHIYLRWPAVFVPDQKRERSGCEENHGGMSVKKVEKNKININFVLH